MKWTTAVVAAVLLAAILVPAGGEGIDKTDSIVLSNSRVMVTISKPHRGGIISMVDLGTGREMIAAQQSPRLFQLTFSKRDDRSGERFYVSSREAANVAYEVTGDTARMTFADLKQPGIGAVCTAGVSEDDTLVRWRLTASYPDDLVLEEVQFPFVVLSCAIFGHQADDAMVMGSTKGGVYHRPSQWSTTRRISARQPGSLAAQFATYYNTSQGFFFASYDNKGYPKTVECRRTEEGLEMDWDRHCFDPGSFDLDYDVVMASFGSAEPGTPVDWRNGADIYRAWAEKQHWCARKFADRDDVPDWLKSGPAMVRFSRSWLADVERIEGWLTDYWRKFFPAGTHLVTAYWGWEKVASWVTPDYFPIFPSDEDFERVVSMSRKLDCHAFPWPSGYHYTMTYEKHDDGSFMWDDRERFDRIARPHAIQNRDGELYRRPASWLSGGENACMCPGDPWTIDWFNDISVELCKRGSDMVQVDQVVGGAFPSCYNRDHEHQPGPGLWMTQVFRDQLETMLAKCREVEPEAVVCFEEPNEHFIQQAAIQDYRDWEVMRRGDNSLTPASVFNYIYHEYLPTFQSNPLEGDKLSAAHCLVTGQIPHMVPSMLIGPGPSLANGGFEEWGAQAPSAWDKVGGYQGQVWNGKCFRDDEQKHSGGSSLRLENREESETVQVSQNVPVGGDFRIGGTYRISVWMRSAQMSRPNVVNFGAMLADGSFKGVGNIPIPNDTAGEWVKGDVTFTVPAESRLLRIMQHVAGPATVWLDDMMMEEVLPDGGIREVMRKKTPLDHEFMLRWVELYNGEGRPYLQHGRTLNLPKLEAGTAVQAKREFPVIMHNAYRAPDGSEAVIMVNVTDAEQSGTLTWQGQERTITLAPWEIRLVKQ